MTNEITKINTTIAPKPIRPAEIKNQIKAIQSLMRECMIDSKPYGTIPGCGDKKVLFKSGAEKLCMMFRFRPEYKITKIDLLDNHRDYLVETVLYSGHELAGGGIGSCSTMESKYRYRKGEGENTGQQLDGKYWTYKKSDPQKAQELIGGKGFFPKKVDGTWFIFKSGDGKIENPDPADQYNTVLKMAKKRSLVDAVLTTTAASDIFDQDLGEEIEESYFDQAVDVTLLKEEKKSLELITYSIPNATKNTVDWLKSKGAYQDAEGFWYSNIDLGESTEKYKVNKKTFASIKVEEKKEIIEEDIPFGMEDTQILETPLEHAKKRADKMKE